MSPAAKLFMILLSAAPLTAIAQGIDTYPSRQVRILCGCMVGGNPDVLGRLVGQKLEQQLGKPFVIENIPGAGGLAMAVGIDCAVRSRMVRGLGQVQVPDAVGKPFRLSGRIDSPSTLLRLPSGAPTPAILPVEGPAFGAHRDESTERKI